METYRMKESRAKLQEEASLGCCLKDIKYFSQDINNNNEWKCPFCVDLKLSVPTKKEIAGWAKCRELINQHLDAHRSILLRQASIETLYKYDRHVKGSRRRTNFWINGTMKDRGLGLG